MTPQLTTRTAAEYELLDRFRAVSDNGRKALLMWARAVHRLNLAPPLPKVRRHRTRKAAQR